MTSPSANSTIGLLASGGLDSCILVGHLLRQGHGVQPFYVRGGLLWEEAELSALRAFLRALKLPRLEDLVVFDLPLADLYGAHWSIDGHDAPDARSPDTRRLLARPKRPARHQTGPLVRPARHRATGPGHAGRQPVRRRHRRVLPRLPAGPRSRNGQPREHPAPFARLQKEAVLQLGQGLPLELTFSCIVPSEGLHCGRCNKCAERQRAFRSAGIDDPTSYKSEPCSTSRVKSTSATGTAC